MSSLPATRTDHNHEPESSLIALCPTCKEYSVFSYIGSQTFPQAVADKTGLPATIHLYRCEQCKTTMNHLDLHKYQEQ